VGFDAICRCDYFGEKRFDVITMRLPSLLIKKMCMTFVLASHSSLSLSKCKTKMLKSIKQPFSRLPQIKEMYLIIKALLKQILKRLIEVNVY